jgi:putative ABC transport system permease protein
MAVFLQPQGRIIPLLRHKAFVMLRNYFKIAWRSLMRNKAYSVINVTGLAVGITCCVLISLYVKDELSYDRYHVNADNIYRVTHAYRDVQADEKLPPPAPEDFQVWGNAPIGPALAADFPQIRKVVQFTSPSDYLFQYQDKRFQESNIIFMDSAAFDIFSWKMLAGDARTALQTPYSIVLTKSLAQKYFGNADPVGQAIRLDNTNSFTVTGVMEDVPSNSQFTFNGLISMNTFRQLRKEIFTEWGYIDFYTYFLLDPHADIKTLEAGAAGFVQRHMPNEIPGAYTIGFERLTDAYLHSRAQRQPGVTGSLSNVYIFSMIAVFILFIACINFMNLATARSMERAKEVGVRKAVGAYQQGLISQFLTESVVISLVATVLAVALIFLALPYLREITGKPFPYEDLVSWKALPVLIITPLAVGVLSGSYPAWVLARFRPAIVLKGKFESSGKGVMMRKGLVVLQFTLSIALIACTAIVFTQLNHLRKHGLGFKQEQMLVIDYGGDQEVNNKIEVIKTALGRNPAVLMTSASRAVPGEFFPNAYTQIESPSGEMVHFAPSLYEIDFDFIPLYEIKMAAGRPYSRDFPADVEQSLVINEAAAKLYGYANPLDIVGKRFDQWGRKGTVIGVVKDFNYQSLHHKVEPLALRMAPPRVLNRISLRVKADHIAQTTKELENSWRELVPHRPFLYSFLDQSFNHQYQQDERFGKVFTAFAFLTIFIACLGLFGLATYATEQRIKEIGIRKVLGASVTNIVSLLSSGFVKLVMVAFLIATPIAWWAMHQWLQGFAYRVTIQWWVFALAGVLAIVIALFTVSYQAVRAALMNPIRSLKTD